MTENIAAEVFLLIEEKMESTDDGRSVKTTLRGVYASEEAARTAFEGLKAEARLTDVPPSDGGILFQAAGDCNWHRLYLIWYMEGGADVALDGFRIDF